MLSQPSGARHRDEKLEVFLRQIAAGEDQIEVLQPAGGVAVEIIRTLDVRDNEDLHPCSASATPRVEGFTPAASTVDWARGESSS